MSRRRFFTLLLVAILGIGSALYLSSRRNRTPELTGAPLFPSLAAAIADVDSVSIRRGSATPGVALRRNGAAWSVSERDGYPADTAKLRRLLLSLADARVVEEKTANPANYAVIGVEDPTAPGATSTEVSFTVNAAAKPASRAVIIGKSAGEGSYVRLVGAARSELVAPGISVEADPHDWIDPRLLDVPLAMITALEIHPAAGPGYVLRRARPDTTEFTLTAVPPGRTALGSNALAPAATAFADLTVEDVAPAATVDFSKPATATLSLSDGRVLTLLGSVVGNEHWITVESSKDAALSAKTRGRAYALAAYRYDAIFRPLEQLLQPKPSSATATGERPSAAPAKLGRARPAAQPPP